jgi:hypothetical protein
LLTLHAIREVRLALLGEAQPSRLDRLAREFAEAAGAEASDGERAWASALALWSRVQAERMRGSASTADEPEEQVSALAAGTPLVGCDDELNTWLQNLHSGSRGR